MTYRVFQADKLFGKLIISHISYTSCSSQTTQGNLEHCCIVSVFVDCYKLYYGSRKKILCWMTSRCLSYVIWRCCRCFSSIKFHACLDDNAAFIHRSHANPKLKTLRQHIFSLVSMVLSAFSWQEVHNCGTCLFW